MSSAIKIQDSINLLFIIGCCWVEVGRKQKKKVPQNLRRMFQHQNKVGFLVKYGTYSIWLNPWQKAHWVVPFLLVWRVWISFPAITDFQNGSHGQSNKDIKRSRGRGWEERREGPIDPWHFNFPWLFKLCYHCKSLNIFRR